MQSIFSSWAIAVTVAVLFSAVVSSLLPETSIKKYILVVLGVVVTIIILSPLFKYLGGINIQQEMKGALESIKEPSVETHFRSSYGDYIFKVYMGDE